jgi:hypothetical protein
MQDLFCSLLQTILAEDGQPIAPPKMAERWKPAERDVADHDRTNEAILLRMIVWVCVWDGDGIKSRPFFIARVAADVCCCLPPPIHTTQQTQHKL